MKQILSAAFLAGALFAAGSAGAMPLAPPASATADVIEVAGGCGPGWYRGPYGGCQPMGRAVVVAPAPIVVAPAPVVVVPRARVCPYGWRWYAGRCRPI